MPPFAKLNSPVCRCWEAAARYQTGGGPRTIILSRGFRLVISQGKSFRTTNFSKSDRNRYQSALPGVRGMTGPRWRRAWARGRNAEPQFLGEAPRRRLEPRHRTSWLLCCECSVELFAPTAADSRVPTPGRKRENGEEIPRTPPGRESQRRDPADATSVTGSWLAMPLSIPGGTRESRGRVQRTGL